MYIHTIMIAWQQVSQPVAHVDHAWLTMHGTTLADEQQPAYALQHRLCGWIVFHR